MKLRYCLAAATAACLFVSPAVAQRSAYDMGGYTDVSEINVLPGQMENYIDFLKAKWLPEQQWAKAKGYITGYSILTPTYARKDEPNVLLITTYKEMPTSAELKKRQDEYVSFVKMDEHQMAAAAAGRAPMRVVGSQEQFQEIVLK